MRKNFARTAGKFAVAAASTVPIGNIELNENMEFASP